MSMAPPKKVNYQSASLRHLQDGVYLQDAGRNANAAQLYGFCAECALKALLVACGISIDSDGGIRRGNPDFRRHIDELAMLQATITSYLAGRSGARYIGYFSGLASFGSWKVDHRYYDESHPPFPMADLPKYRVAASAMLRGIQQAKMDGVL